MTMARKLALMALTVVVMTVSHAQQMFAPQEEFYLGLSFGGGDLDIDQSSFPDATFVVNDISGDVLVGEFSAGYRFANNFTLDFGFEGYDSFNILGIGDVIDLKTIRLGGGYHFPSSTRVSGFVKGGLSFWDIDFTESLFLNPGPEQTASRDGTDLYLQFGGEVRVGRSFAARITFDVSNPDFGDTRALKLWLGAYF